MELKNQPQMNDLINLINGNMWAIIPEKLESFIQSASSKLSKDAPQKVNEVFPKDNEYFSGYGYKTVGSVAVINIAGVIEKNFTISGLFYGDAVSTEMIKKDIQDAIENPQITSIVLNIDSPGGLVDGTKELADYIYDMKAVKPIYSYANGLMASAAYYIGSAANKVFTYDTSYVGSIGVYRPHIDASKFYEAWGLNITLIYAGKYKVVGNPYEKLSDEDKKIIQAEVDDQYNLFVSTVARNRGTTADVVKEKMAEGRIFIGQQAVDNGLVDGLLTLEEVVAYAQNESNVNKKDKFFNPNQKESKMNILGLLKGKEQIAITLESLKENASEIYNQIIDLGKAEAEKAIPAAIEAKAAEAVTAERARVSEIMELAKANSALTEKAVEMIASGKSAGEAAKEMLKVASAKAKESDALNTFGAGAAEKDKQGTDKVSKESPEAIWEGDKDLQARYAKRGGKDAYMKHMAEWNKEESVRTQFNNNVAVFLADRRSR